MKATNEQIFNAAVTLMAGAMAGDIYGNNARSRLKYRSKEDAENAVKLAKMIAEAIED